VHRSPDSRASVPDPGEQPWWRTAVFYEVYVRSFADSDGDGVGDLAGIRAKLGYLHLLGVDALWLTPFYPSPMVDHGYDVADPRDVDPLFGTLADVDALVADAHALGIKVTIDLVPNHTSDRHADFAAAPSRRTTGTRSSAARPGNGSRMGSGTCICSRRSSRTSTGPTRRWRRTSRRRCGSGWTAGSTGSASTWRTGW
jgi:glycosidase